MLVTKSKPFNFAGLWLEIRAVRRAEPPHAEAHRRQTISMQAVWTSIQQEWSFVTTHETTHGNDYLIFRDFLRKKLKIFCIFFYVISNVIFEWLNLKNAQFTIVNAKFNLCHSKLNKYSKIVPYWWLKIPFL